MAVTPQQVLTDPKFQALTPEQRKQVLMKIDPNFVKLSPSAQQQVMNYRQPTATPTPTGATSPERPTRVGEMPRAGEVWQGISEPLVPEGRAEKEGKALSTSAPTKRELDINEVLPTLGPLLAGAKRGVAGTYADTAETLRGFTSPISIATAALGKVASGTGALAKAARAMLTASGLTYGAQGVGQALQGAGEISDATGSPQGWKDLFSGTATALGAAPSVAQSGRYVRQAASKIAPGLSLESGPAFFAAMRPSMKDAPALRRAYTDVHQELEKSGVKDFGELRDFAEKQRKEAAQEVNTKLVLRGFRAGNIDAVQVGDAIRKRITPWMRARSDFAGQLPPEARAIANEADHIEQNLLQKPIGISQAEAIVQDINAELTQFRKLSPDAQRMAITQGDPVAVMTAVKEELQGQIDAKMAGYLDLKKKYANYKEIQQQTENRINRLERAGADVDYMQRHGAEAALAGLGAIFSHGFLSGVSSILAGRAAGDVLLESSRRPENLLRRSLNPPKPIPFGGQIVQPVAQGDQDEQAQTSQ